MMKTILLLAFALFVSGSPVPDNKVLLKDFLDHLKNVSLPKEAENKFLRDLNTDDKHKCLCQAEKELNKLSGLTEYGDFRTDGTLMRNLHDYNKHHGNKNCQHVDEKANEILVWDFLKNLRSCVQILNSKRA